MATTRAALLPALVALLLLAGCSAEPAPSPDSSSPAIDTTEQSAIIGEWTLTRTVTATDDAANPAHAVGTVSTRALLFADVTCADGPCSGNVQSGPTTGVRDTTPFASSGNTISYEFTGYLNCLRQDTGAVLVANGYAYTATVTLTVISTDATDDSLAATLEGTMTYSDSLTPEAIEAGCTREPLEATTEYSLSAVRAVAATTAPVTAPEASTGGVAPPAQVNTGE